MLLSRFLAAAMVASLATAAAVAQGGPGGGGGMFRTADTNNDGMISRAEATAEATTRFDRIDVNKDGQISQAELATWMDRMRGGMRQGGRPDDAGAPPPATAPATTPNSGQ